MSSNEPQYREVTSSNPVEVLTFSGFYTQYYLNCVHNCDDHSSLDFKFCSSKIIYETFHISLNIHSSRAH